MCCHVEKRSRSEMPRRDHLLSNARAVSLLRGRLQKPCKQRVKACEKKRKRGEPTQCLKMTKIVSVFLENSNLFDFEINRAHFTRKVAKWDFAWFSNTVCRRHVEKTLVALSAHVKNRVEQNTCSNLAKSPTTLARSPLLSVLSALLQGGAPKLENIALFPLVK